MRPRALGFLVLVALDACGGKAERPASGDGDGRTGGASGASGANSNGGVAGSRTGSASGGSSDRGGGKAAGGGGAGGHEGGEGGEPGAGGEPGPGGTGGESGVRFALLEPPPPLVFPPGESETSEREDELAVTGASRDGSVLAGTFSHRYANFNVPEEREVFVWTEARGVVRLEGTDALPGRRPLIMESAWLSADGTRLFGWYDQQPEDGLGRDCGGFFSWSRSAGFRQAFVIADAAECQVTSVGGDTRAAVGIYRTLADVDAGRNYRTFYWTEADGVSELGAALGLPEVFEAATLTPDGSALLVNSVDREPTRAFRYSRNAGTRPLGVLDGLPSCVAEFMSDDAEVIVGSCSNAKESRVFRWTETEGMVALDGFDSNDAVRTIDADGSVMLGVSYTSAGRHELFRWSTEDGKSRVPAPPESSVEPSYGGLNAEGSVAFGQFLPNDTLDPRDPGTQAFRWTNSAGIEPLGFLAGDERSEAFTATSDRTVVGGASFYVLGRAVLWDRLGIRDIEAELDSAGIDRKGSELLLVERLWKSELTLVVQGIDTDLGAWVAWLPRRE